MDEKQEKKGNDGENLHGYCPERSDKLPPNQKDSKNPQCDKVGSRERNWAKWLQTLANQIQDGRIENCNTDDEYVEQIWLPRASCRGLVGLRNERRGILVIMGDGYSEIKVCPVELEPEDLDRETENAE